RSFKVQDNIRCPLVTYLVLEILFLSLLQNIRHCHRLPPVLLLPDRADFFRLHPGQHSRIAAGKGRHVLQTDIPMIHTDIFIRLHIQDGAHAITSLSAMYFTKVTPHSGLLFPCASKYHSTPKTSARISIARHILPFPPVICSLLSFSFADSIRFFSRKYAKEDQVSFPRILFNIFFSILETCTCVIPISLAMAVCVMSWK